MALNQTPSCNPSIGRIGVSLSLQDVIYKEQQLLEGGPTSHVAKLLGGDALGEMTNHMVIGQSLQNFRSNTQ